jgi:hypothetical protein
MRRAGWWWWWWWKEVLASAKRSIFRFECLQERPDEISSTYAVNVCRVGEQRAPPNDLVGVVQGVSKSCRQRASTAVNAYTLTPQNSTLLLEP